MQVRFTISPSLNILTLGTLVLAQGIPVLALGIPVLALGIPGLAWAYRC